MSLQSLMNAAKHLVVEEDPEEQHPPPSQPTTAPIPPAPVVSGYGASILPAAPVLPVSSGPALGILGTAPVMVNPEMQAKLQKLTDDAASPQYRQFVAMLASLTGVIADESTRYRAVFAALLAQGVTLDNVLASLGESLKLLEEKGREFETHAEARLQEKTTGGQQDLLKVEEAIKEKQASIEGHNQEIRRLQEEIGGLAEERGKVTAAAAEAVQKLDRTTREFAATLASVQQTLNGEREKITRYAPQAQGGTKQ
jgi:chromosome segregation ATPase